jgi:hypothetical protein
MIQKVAIGQSAWPPFFQNEYFNENWISRGVPTTEVIWENELGLSMSVADGLANEG